MKNEMDEVLIEYDIVYNIDARKLADVLGKFRTIKSTITSPPYYNMKDYGSEDQIGFGQTYSDYLEDLKQIFSSVYQLTDNDGSLWIIIDTFKSENQVVTLPFDLSNKLTEIGWLLQDIIIWKKDKTVPWSNNRFVQRKFEYILFFSKSKIFKYNKDRVRNFDTNQLKKWWIKYPERYNPKGKALDEIWEFPIPVQGSWGKEYIRHFCPLPKEMVATMIEISTDVNDVILDPFSGSGAVLFQSAVMNRKYVGFELNPDYINMFDHYLKSNLENAKLDYARLQNSGNQDKFEKMILDLRALKYGRLLVNELEKKLKLDLKVLVKILEYYNDVRTHLLVQYDLIVESLNYAIPQEEISKIINKPPLSKFGIKPVINKLNDELDLNSTGYYKYTKSNSYSFSELPFNSSEIKVISKICVQLNESDYI